MSMWSSLLGLAGQAGREPAHEVVEKDRSASSPAPPANDSKANVLRRKLQDTVAEREALDSRIRALRTELRFCETSREALLDMEVWISSQVAELEEASKPLSAELTSLDDFCGAQASQPLSASAPSRASLLRSSLRTPRSAGRSPRTRTPRAASPRRVRGEPERPLARCEPSAGSAVAAPALCAAQEWEDSLGKDTATCCHCGLKFPLDAEMIEMHSKQCSQRPRKSSRNMLEMVEDPRPAKVQQGAMRRSQSWSLPERSSARRWSLLDVPLSWAAAGRGGAAPP
mmetsp:Transcript_78007/g.135204  ORF Transcript_78007/g.135204 Transcript_78007/m.135204 type:complete len:285 (-) Transcript_78007:44-898(-)